MPWLLTANYQQTQTQRLGPVRRLGDAERVWMPYYSENPSLCMVDAVPALIQEQCWAICFRVKL